MLFTCGDCATGGVWGVVVAWGCVLAIGVDVWNACRGWLGGVRGCGSETVCCVSIAGCVWGVVACVCGCTRVGT